MDAAARRTILIVEDDPIIGFAETMKIRGFGYDAKLAATGEAAIETTLGDESIGLVLMDIDLGKGIDGPEAARRILAERVLPIVFLTSHSEKAFVDRVREITRYGYVLKNSTDFVLQTSIEMAFELFEAHEGTRDSEARLLRAEAVSGFGSWEFDMGTRRVHASEGARKIYGLGGAEWDISAVQKIPLPEYRPALDAALAGLIESGAAYDIEFQIRRPTDGALAWIHSVARYDRRRGLVIGIIQDITERKRSDRERDAIMALLVLLNGESGLRELMRGVTALMRDWSECEAIGIRLAEGPDFPYYETRGFPDDFVLLESGLCERTDEGQPVRDFSGNPVLDCMCGNVIRGRFDPSQPFFTEKGSFWTNSTTALLASTSEADRQARTRNRCNGEGYESVALVALRHGGRAVGLLQLNDKRPGIFAPADIALFERAADYLAIGIFERWESAKLRASEARLRELGDQE